ncbi:MAG TPA: GNAT family N-acetyltransferase [Polyangia bacterium]|nr:GNAT family N-acetyltransferase [Polyangia bacterium]
MSPREVAVRPARPEDWLAVQSLLRELDELHAELVPAYFRPASRTEPEWRRLLGDATALALVALEEVEESRAPIGFLSLRVYDTPADPTMVPRRRGHVETLIVNARQRRRGIGQRLLATAADWARARAATEMVLTTWVGNAEADAFYEKLGYRVLSRVLHARL